MKRALKRLFALTEVASAVLFLSACGGGSGASEGADATPMAQGRAKAQAAETWVRIASEGGNFSTTGTQVVRYGSGSAWVQKTVAGIGQCTNAYFGADPLNGVVKECQAQAADAAPAPAPAPGVDALAVDFLARCAQPGVVKCVGFDDAADFDIGAGGAAGAYGKNAGIFAPSGTTDYTKSARDTGVKASGGGSLKFTIPANSGSDSSGSYFTNFSKDLSVQFGENAEFYIQWRQRFSPEFLAAPYAGGGGWKQLIVGAGDQPGGQFQTSCTDLETVVQNTGHKGFAQMYNSCTGSASHGAYNPFEEAFGAFDFKLQNARPSPHCLYSQSSTSYFSPVGNCLGYVANEWMTFQVRIKTGPRVNDEFTNSHVSLWIAREGKPSELAISWGPYNLSAGAAAQGQRFGKVWLLPYNTGKNASVTNPTAYTWYDELIISRSKIADPMQAPAPAPVPATWVKAAGEGQSFIVSGTQTVRYGSGSTWIQKSVSGTGHCTNAFFGKDPLVGIVKECLVSSMGSGAPAPAPATWTRIATEGQSFSISGTQLVRYGAGATWIQKSVTGAGQCTNAFFANDPLNGTVKECQVQSPAPGAAGSAAISWSVPMSNADGTALTDIAGYRVFYGTNPGSLSNVVNVAGASSTSTSVTGLAAGTYYFAVATVNSSGVQSVASNVASKVVQ